MFAGEGGVFAGALDFHEFPGFGHDDVHVHIGAGVFFVGQVKADVAVDEPNGDGCNGREQGVSGDHPASFQLGDGVGEGDVRAGDGRGAGAAVGLQDVAVDGNGVFPEFPQVNGRPKGPANQSRDFVGPAFDFAFHGFARHAFVGGGGQHGVFGGEPALPGAVFEARNAFFHAGGAHDAGVAEFHKHAACGVVGESSGDADGSHLVLGAAVGSFE